MRITLVTAALVAIGWMAWSVVADTTAESLAEAGPRTALAFSPNNVSALNRLSELELADPKSDLEFIKSLSQKALSTRPIDQRALFLLGAVADRQRDRAASDRLMLLAGSRSWSDALVQTWLYDRAIKHAAFADALLHADALLRSTSAVSNIIFPSLAAFTANPAAFDQLVQFLGASPPWRSWYLGQLSPRLTNRGRVEALYAALARASHPPSREEWKPYVTRLVSDQQFVMAKRIWEEQLAPPGADVTATPFNGNFELPPDGTPFNWLLSSVQGADIDLVKVADPGGSAVRLQFSGARVDFGNVAQLLLLPPGGYILSGLQKAESLETTRGLGWHLLCADGAKQSVAFSNLLSGSKPWSAFKLEFKIPEQGCTAQWLRLELPARTQSEKRIEGQAWYRSLKIEPDTDVGTGTRAGG